MLSSGTAPLEQRHAFTAELRYLPARGRIVNRGFRYPLYIAL